MYTTIEMKVYNLRWCQRMPPEEKEKESMEASKRSVYPMAITAVMAAVTCVVSPFSINIGPIPISLCTLALYLSVYLLGWKRGAVSCLVYILLGLVGMPVFSNFSGGLAKVAGPTGGYIVGYIPLVIIAGILVERYDNRIVQLLGMVLGTVVLYALGTAWFCVQSGTPLGEAMGMCVIPFIPGDLIKMVIALVLGPVIRDRLKKAGLLGK